jgi:S1-C subfamily serine protease
MTTTAQSVSAALSEAARAVTSAVGPAVVRIGRHGGRGCGVVIADGHVLTNAHNVRERTTLVTFGDGRGEQATVTAVDLDGDLVVVAVPTGDIAPVTWAEDPPEPGGLVFALARTPGGGARVTVGLISSTDGAFRGPRGRAVTGSIEHTAPLARGSSGSPLLDDAGHLLGLNTARLGDGFYAARTADPQLRARVDELLRGEAPRRHTLGIGLAPAGVSAKLRASVGLPERAGLLVRAVDPEGPAAAAGVLVGDLVVSAGGREVARVDDLHAALDEAATRTTLDLRLVRATEELTVTVTFPDEEATS